MIGQAKGECRVSFRLASIALLAILSPACTTVGEPRPLTAAALDRAKVACRAPDAELSIDEHVSIVLPSDTPARERQIQCFFDWLHARGYWVDQIVTEHADSAGS